MKTIDILGGTVSVYDTFEVRAPRGEFFDLTMAYAAAREQHPELATMTLLSVRYVTAEGVAVDWQGDYTETVWTFELPAPDTQVTRELVFPR